MASKIEVLLAVADHATKELDKVTGGFRRFESQAGAVISRVASLQNILRVSIGGVALGAVAKSVIDVGGKIETFRAQLLAVSGSAEEAGRRLNALREFAAPTALKTEDVVQAYIRLRAVGIDPTVEQMRVLGGVALLFGRDMTSVNEALIGMEKETLRRLGIEITRTGNTAVITSGNVKRVVSNDTASIRRALIETWAERFPGALKEAGNTLAGRMAVLKSNLFELAASMAETFLPIVKEALTKLSSQLERVRSYIVSHKDTIIESVGKIRDKLVDFYGVIEKMMSFIWKYKDYIFFGAMVAISARVIVAIASITTALRAMNLALLANPIVLVTAGIAALGVALVETSRQWEDWKKNIGRNTELKQAADQLNMLNEVHRLYNEQLAHTETIASSAGVRMILNEWPGFEANRKRMAELEKALGGYGVALEGSLIQKAEAAELALSSLTANVNATTRAVAAMDVKLPNLGTGDMGSGLAEELEAYNKKHVAALRAVEDTKREIEALKEKIKVNAQAIAQLIAEQQIEAKKFYNDVVLTNMKDQNKASLAIIDQEEQENLDKVEWWYTQGIISKERYEDLLTEVHRKAADKRKAITENETKSIVDMNFAIGGALMDIAQSITRSIAKESKERQRILIAMAWVDLGGAAVKSIYDVWQDKSTDIYTKIALTAATAAEVIATGASLISQMQSAYALGTSYSRGGLALVGEHGPELVNMPRGSRVYTNYQTRNTNIAGDTVHLHFDGGASRSTIDYAMDKLETWRRQQDYATRRGYLRYA